jgi:hypothetical protein
MKNGGTSGNWVQDGYYVSTSVSSGRYLCITTAGAIAKGIGVTVHLHRVICIEK